jgi:hypothetical protein
MAADCKKTAELLWRMKAADYKKAPLCKTTKGLRPKPDG